MTIYYIDNNRGNDSNTGLTKDLAWKSLEGIRNKLVTGAITAGDSFLFEAESTFTPSRYLRFGSSSEPLTLINGTSGNPITFDKYNYSSTSSSSKPTFTLLLTAVDSDWKWDSTKNLWYWEHPSIYGTSNIYWGLYPYVEINGQMCQITRSTTTTFDRGEDPSNYLEVSTNSMVYPGKLYVWTPNASSNPLTNPTAVYGVGAVKAYSSQLGIFQFNRCGSYINMSNLKSYRSALLVGIYNDSSGAGNITNVNISNNQSINCSQLARTDVGYDFNKTIDGFILNGNYGENLGAGMFMGSTKNLLIENNIINGMNFARSDGGGFYIANTKNYPSTGIIQKNKLYNAKYETGKCTADGCAIYLETGTDNITVRQNEIYDSMLAMQDNTGKGGNIWYSNYIKNCDKGMTITDQDNVATTFTTVKVYNNTFHNIKLNSLYPTMPTARLTAIACRKGSSNPSTNYGYDFKNNIIIGSGATAAANYGFLVESNTTQTFANNLVYGFGTVKADEYSFANKTTPATTITVDPQLAADGYSTSSAIKSAGVKLTSILTDKNSNTYATPPDVGCYSIFPFRNVTGILD